MKNISKEDYIIWDNDKKEPVESLDIVYHHSTIIEMINETELTLLPNEEIKCVASLPIKWQQLIDEAIERTK